MSLGRYQQLFEFLNSVNLVDRVAGTPPELPLTIESLLREKSLKWCVKRELPPQNLKQSGPILLGDFTRSSGMWAQYFDGSFVFSGDALLLLDIALAESRTVAASPRSLTQRISHVRNTLAVCDRWFWEVKIVDGKTTYQQYGTADFSQLGLE
jgi:hypothetical protein